MFQWAPAPLKTEHYGNKWKPWRWTENSFLAKSSINRYLPRCQSVGSTTGWGTLKRLWEVQRTLGEVRRRSGGVRWRLKWYDSFCHTYLSVFCLFGTVYNALIGMLVLRLHICTSQWSGRDWDLGTQDAKWINSLGNGLKGPKRRFYFSRFFK